METYNRVSPAALEPRRGPAKHSEVFDMADDTANPLNVPYGYCHCGCGQKTKIATRTRATRNVYKGEPHSYCYGHWVAKRRISNEIVLRDSFAILKLHGGKSALIDLDDIAAVEGFTWRARRGRHTYYVTGAKYGDADPNQRYQLHRVILNTSPDEIIDHKNQNGLDNRRANLRPCSHSENNWNARKNSRNSSGYRGVSWHEKGGWRFSYRHLGESHQVFGFSTPEEAARAYDQTIRKLRGEFAMLNFPDDADPVEGTA